ARRTLVLATCDPAAHLLATEYARQTPFRMLVLRRSSLQSLELLQREQVHVAGVHLVSSSASSNQAEMQKLRAAADLTLLTVTHWEEGVAFASGLKLRSGQQAARSKLRWISRAAGSGARRSEDELLGGRPASRHVARDHQDVVA